ncbi:carbonic anhydrase [Cryphonectria parasitica EP155]|uniref:Carbonic anhydrase n=1 Tax=Cryphonectria parasitica (strain ATCC 38755 / EP155) TaxID=660469 RepID=A0A9P4Y0C6_CRYP1|nr:carbonic anhydrase [Cryphonectria parasitica EP155]KAF3764067.1 carbonic anhydrase [Cryphonectria parasitica EP155]
MTLFTFIAVLSLVASNMACPTHDNHQLLAVKARHLADRATVSPDWSYQASFDWGSMNPDYGLCQTGTQQSPIALSLSNGLASNHRPTFQYDSNVTGTFFNWNFGPAFTPSHTEGEDYTSAPSLTYDNETTYLTGWHLHAPADHTVGGMRSKAEMHFVHVNASGHEKAVLAFRIDPGNVDNAFFAQLPAMIGFNETDTVQEATLDLSLALDSVSWFNEYWTYQGSLTSPPCSEGIRWFIARDILFVGIEQMQAILGASTYSARDEQQVWLHRINE